MLGNLALSVHAGLEGMTGKEMEYLKRKKDFFTIAC